MTRLSLELIVINAIAARVIEEDLREFLWLPKEISQAAFLLSPFSFQIMSTSALVEVACGQESLPTDKIQDGQQ